MKVQPDGEMRVQWGTASNADTTTGQTGAGPTDTDQTDTSACAGVDFLPFPPSHSEFMKTVAETRAAGEPLPTFSAGEQCYLIERTEGQVVMWPVTLGTPETQADREQRRAEERRKRDGEFQALRLEHPTLDPIIMLHSPSEYGECTGCDGGPDYSGDWPCRTIETIQEEY
jgi:hypothetical protein